jgi:dihydrofolate synthase/folylpolyglutamate synthase
LPEPAVHGEFQLQNAATALAALACLPLPSPSDAAVAAGLTQLRLPGRFQVLPGEPEVILDVAHNPQAVAALAATLRARPVPGQTVAVFGCMQDKDIGSMVDEMAPLIARWCVTDLPVPRAAKAKHLWHLLRGGGHACTTHSDVTSALQAAAHACSPGDRIVVFGSFHAIAPVLSPVHEAQHGLRPGAFA